MGKFLGIALIGVLAVAGGIAAATYITKKKLEQENEDDFDDDWDTEDDWELDESDFDDDESVDDKPAAAPVIKPEMVEDEKSDDKDETL